MPGLQPDGRSVGWSRDEANMKLSAASRSSMMAVAIAALAIAAASILASRSAQATQAMAQQTGKSCDTCHTVVPALNKTGQEYKATGKLPGGK